MLPNGRASGSSCKLTLQRCIAPNLQSMIYDASQVLNCKSNGEAQFRRGTQSCWRAILCNASLIITDHSPNVLAGIEANTTPVGDQALFLVFRFISYKSLQELDRRLSKRHDELPLHHNQYETLLQNRSRLQSHLSKLGHVGFER